MEKYSFIKDFIGANTYEDFKDYSRKVVPIGTVILAILVLLSRFVYSDFICNILNFVTGTSLLFVVYIISILRYSKL